MQNLILGIIDNYKFKEIKNFLISLSKTNYSGHTCLFVGPEISANTLKKIKSFNVETILYKNSFPFISNPHPNNFKALPEPIHIYNFRHYLYYDYLLHNQNKFENVLLTDVKDVFFQKNPFDFKISNSVHVAIENTSILINSCSWTTKWIKRGYDDDVYEQLKDKEVICAGTTLGPTHLILEYLTKLINEFFSVKDAYKCADQAMHNKLIHFNTIESITKSYNFMGPILTVGTEQKYLLDEEKKLVGHRGEIIPIIHQYDRHEELIRIFNKKNKPVSFLSKIFKAPNKLQNNRSSNK